MKMRFVIKLFWVDEWYELALTFPSKAWVQGLVWSLCYYWGWGATWLICALEGVPSLFLSLLPSCHEVSGFGHYDPCYAVLSCQKQQTETSETVTQINLPFGISGTVIVTERKLASKHLSLYQSDKNQSGVSEKAFPASNSIAGFPEFGGGWDLGISKARKFYLLSLRHRTLYVRSEHSVHCTVSCRI